MCVVLHHGAGSPALLAATGIAWLPNAFGSIWSGRSAVIAFFIISGFCVHGPYVGVDRIDRRAFWTRRYIRVGLPLIAILPVAALFDVSYSPYDGWVTWTLVCEIAYYTAYPALRMLAGRKGWVSLVIVGYIVGYSSIALQAAFPESAPAIAAGDILGNLPVWMLGCWLADVGQQGPKIPSVWIMRIATLCASLAYTFAHIIGLVSQNWTAPAFGLLATLWLLAELRHDATFRILSKGGSWSYSLYLIHPVAIIGIAPLLFSHMSIRTAHAAGLLATPIIAYVFFVLVERPSHILARRMSASALFRDRVERAPARQGMAPDPINPV